MHRYKKITKNIYMKNKFCFIIILIFCLILLTPSSIKVFADEDKLNFDTYKYDGKIEHFFTHQVINRPDLAFNSANKYRFNFYRDCVTYTEFERFLNEMYLNDYVLVDIYDCYGFKDGVPYKKDLYLPINKKPFLLSFDDMSFDTKNKGMSDKLILDENGNIATYTEGNETKVEYNKEAIPILENFIKLHPDFSINNARGIICPTGYNGILGYRINSENPNRERHLKILIPLVQRLKELNYHFGSHTFNHIRVGEVSVSELKEDTKRYTEDILSCIGETDIYCFPCGKYTISDEKLKVLNDAGYKIFLCVGLSKDHFVKNNNLYLSRKVLDGNSLKQYHENYLPIIDTNKIYDYSTRV